ncbi:MAG: aminotransferase class I/II-fold pyridoxal phosphate-dependent enzyme [Gammaproteobacteria bacterium]|nr:aminotransferase class I/II-fold pyridoxal phosphate-dependent enzyme [Gammaproteobacteria bacterium]
MTLMRPEIELLEASGIARVALPRLGDPKVIPLWFGEGDLVTADFIREAAKDALDRGYTFYSHTLGRMELRTAIKAYLDRLYGIDVNVARVAVPGSSMMGITLASQMALGRGLHGLIVGPVWPNIDRTFTATGAEVSYVRQREDGARWSLDVAEIIAGVRDNTRAIFVNSPCNPTGWIMSAQSQAELLEFCRARNILLISDEVYHRNVYDGAEAAPSLMTLAGDEDPVIVVNGFSKAWAMTGWRLGWMIVPARYSRHVAVLSECFNTGAPSFIQMAGITALERGEDVVRDLRARYARGRELVMRILGADPRIELIEPEGAFYAFPRVAGLRSSLAFAEDLLTRYDVGVAPGYTFGPGNEEHFRLCFAQSHERLEEALSRIVAYLDDGHAAAAQA